MVDKDNSGIARRPGARGIAVLVVLALSAGVFGVLFAWLWRGTAAELDVTGGERRGVAQLRPLTELLGALAAAQSAAVSGGEVDGAAVRTAVAEVDTADRAYGDRLGTRQLWSDLRTKVTSVLVSGVTGAAALDAYGDVVTLAHGMTRKVGGASGLLLDRDLDSFHLADVAVTRIPGILAATGRAVDSAPTAGNDRAGGEPTARIAAARHQISADADAIATGLGSAMDATGRAALGANLGGPLDAFWSAVNAIAPSTAIEGYGGIRPQALVTAGNQVRGTALPLAEVVFDELQALLQAREDGLKRQRGHVAVAGLVGAVLWIVLGWLCVPGADRRAGGGEQPAHADAAPAGEPAATAPDRPTDGGEVALIDPRDLLAMEELLHVGRGVRPRRRELVDDDAS